MLKKTIKYTDYEGVEKTRDFYFNLNKAELLEMEMGTNGGMERMINKIINAQDTKSIIEIFKDLILRAYGEKSIDGEQFIKSKEASIKFSQTEAFSELFMELATDANAASDFINGIIPQSLAKQIAQKKEHTGVAQISGN